MGWGRTLLLGDVGNRLDIGDCERDIQRMKSEVGEAARVNWDQSERIRRLEKENGEIKLYLAAFARLLISKGVCTREELLKLVEIIDAEDGTQDGNFSKQKIV